MPETTNTTQSIFGGNPYLISLDTAALQRGGRTRARSDAHQLNTGLTEPSIIADIHKRLNELEGRQVKIEVRVRDTPLRPLSESSPSTIHWGLNRVSDDTTVYLCRKDYYENENCLFDLLVERLPFDEWGSATAGVSNHGLIYPDDFELYNSATYWNEDQSRRKCHTVLREHILQIKNWAELVRDGPEDPNAPWFDDPWCITLWRTIKLGN